MVRKPAVSGQFYPKTSKEIEDFVSRLVVSSPVKVSAKGAILPHAGYIYSGKVAVVTCAKILPRKRVVILGPNHTGLGVEFGVYSKGLWEIPQGNVEIDEELAQDILRGGNFIEEDFLAHKFEHSIEVELPILKYFFKEFKFVPIICATASLDTYRKVAQQIYQGIREKKEEILIIASSDMTHYEEDTQARKKDRLAIEAITSLDEAELIRRVKRENISMCGVAPVSIMLILTKLLGARKVEVVSYQTSGEVSGDYSAVVGYLGALVI
ncbi:MAG: AmmeMemoRadiSam system protein B [Candidatus Omnitrophica bacterium]|nr:AmmeMemoRadiSam system protein B [Candidatus Omnitrophota bacterium]